MENNEITAEIDILTLDNEEIFIRKQEGSFDVLSCMLSAAATQLFTNRTMGIIGNNNSPGKFITTIVPLYGISLLTSIHSVTELYSQTANIKDKKELFNLTLECLRDFIEITKGDCEPEKPKAKRQKKAVEK